MPVGPAVVLTQPGTANDTCVIGFTFNVLKAPTQDASGSAGIQTFNLTYAQGTPSVNPALLGTGTTNGVVTVVPPPDIEVVKSATPGSLPQPGGAFTFDLVVSNPGPTSLSITSLNDNIYGNLGDPNNPNVTNNTCDELIGDTLAAGGGSTTCSFVGTFTGVAGNSETDTVTVVGTDEFNNTATDADDATVTLTAPAAAEIVVTKAANPGSLPAPGGEFTFTVQVRNPSAVASITITSLTDNVYGDLATRAGSTCGSLIGVTLAPGATSAPCTFTGSFSGAAGASETDTVTVMGVDSNGGTATDTDQATVTLTPPPPGSPPPPPPPPPAQQVAGTGGTARITGPTGCPTRNFSVIVSGSKIRRVVFYLNGKRVKALNRPNSGSRFVLQVKPGTLRTGTHRVLAVTSFTTASKTKQRTLRRVFQKCGRNIVAPRFTA